MEVRPLVPNPTKACNVAQYTAAEVAALMVAVSPSVNMPPVMHFQSSVWVLALMDANR